MTAANCVAHCFGTTCNSRLAMAPRPVAISKLVPKPTQRPLQTLPLASLLRSLLVLSAAALPSRVLGLTISTLKRHSAFIGVSPLARRLVKHTFYAQYCLGESQAETSAAVARLRQLGLTGVVLAHAKEADANDVTNKTDLQGVAARDGQLRQWLELNLETVDLAQPGDCMAVKYSGAGKRSLQLLCSSADSHAPDQLQALRDAGRRICDAASRKGVKVLLDAEHHATLASVDKLATELMAEFNKGPEAVVFKTFQMYLKETPAKLVSELDTAAHNGYIAGLKLVRGAYLHHELDRSMIHTTKRETDDAYDAAVMFLLAGKQTGSFASLVDTTRHATPQGAADVVLASHNTQSLTRAMDLWHGSASGSTRHLAFAQLLGMADELSLQLAAGGSRNIRVYKYGIWGDVGDCFLYMLRRAEENQDALARSKQSQRAILHELKSRVFG